MEKQRVIKDDGRYIIFYSFGHEREEAGKDSSEDEKDSPNASSQSLDEEGQG